MTVNILVLDDEPWFLGWLQDFEADISVEFCTSFDDAVGALANSVPHIAIVDIMIGKVQSDVVLPPSLANLPPSWFGLRFVYHLRAIRGIRRRQTSLLVHTVLDREDLSQTVENTFEGIYCAKSDAAEFRRYLRREINSHRRR